MTHNHAVTFSPSERVGEHLVRDTVDGLIELVIAATAIH
jgi:hypothetical protein